MALTSRSGQTPQVDVIVNEKGDISIVAVDGRKGEFDKYVAVKPGSILWPSTYSPAASSLVLSMVVS
jgi:hypothetical protein